MARLLDSIESDALPSDAHVVAFTGRETYRFEIGVEIADDDFDAEHAVRARAKLSFHLSEGVEPYFVRGILRAVELVHQHAGKSPTG